MGGGAQVYRGRRSEPRKETGAERKLETPLGGGAGVGSPEV